MTAAVHCYLFEAHSIQPWIFAGGRLRDAVGASALLDGICSWEGDDVFGEALRAAALHAEPDIARRAGGGLCVYHASADDLARLRALMALMVRDRAPDLAFADGLGAGADAPSAYRAARSALQAARNAPAPDPLRAGPFVLPTPRSGAPAALREAPARGGEILDAGLAAKRKAVGEARTALERRFDPDGSATFPVELSEEEGLRRDNASFPFLGENRYLGVVHVDGNGVGGVVQRLGDALGQDGAPGYAAGFRTFSEALADATAAAVRAAMKRLAPSSSGCWPIRPLILGGDDLVALVRGDYAIPFVDAFLIAFEKETAERFDALRSGEYGAFWRDALPARLSAGGGIAFVKAGQPFVQAHALAEDLAKTAKATAKDWLRASGADPANDPPPATLAFHRVVTAAIPSRWDDVLREELTGSAADGSVVLSMNPYVAGTPAAASAPATAPRIERLEHLCRALQDRDVARGPARSLTPAFLVSRQQGAWDRMLRMAHDRNPDGATRFVDALSALGCADGPFRAQGDVLETPILDALSWIAVARRRGGGDEEREADGHAA